MISPFTCRAPVDGGSLGLGLWEPRFGEGGMMRFTGSHQAAEGIRAKMFPPTCGDAAFALVIEGGAGERGDKFPLHFLCIAEER